MYYVKLRDGDGQSTCVQGMAMGWFAVLLTDGRTDGFGLLRDEAYMCPYWRRQGAGKQTKKDLGSQVACPMLS